MKRVVEYFNRVSEQYFPKSVCANFPRLFFRQERDWTCSLACIRTIWSAFYKTVPDESVFVSNYGMKPGPYYSKDIKRLGILDCFNVIYGCDKPSDSITYLADLLQDGYFVMTESLHNYGHWMVLLACMPLQHHDTDDVQLLFYDPYYDEVRLVRADEFLAMWCDGDHVKNYVYCDYIAIRKK